MFQVKKQAIEPLFPCKSGMAKSETHLKYNIAMTVIDLNVA